MKKALLLAFVAVLAACGQDETDGSSQAGGAAADRAPAKFYFSAIPDQGATELNEKFDRIAKHLSAELGVPIEYRASSDYGAAVEMFKNGDIHLAWFGGLSGCQARAAVKGARAIAQGKSDPKFITYFIAHKDSGIEPSDAFPEKLADTNFAFGSEKSTSGRLMPEFFIRKNTGMGPGELFKSIQFSGSHNKTAAMVASGQVQAGAINFKVYDKMVATKKIDPSVCRVVWKTPAYADYNWTAHPDLDKRYGAGFIDKLQDALVGLKGDLLSVFPREAMIPAKNEDFDGIAKVAKQLDLMR
ncbi:MAG: putative selenate ABC transporter substrate-binding protein [Planctomycetota bacterium]